MNTEFLKGKGPSAISRALGVSRQTAAKYVRGEACMTVDQAIMLSQHYCVPLTTVIDPGYEDRNDALTEENCRLQNKLTIIQSLLKNTCNSVDNLIENPEAETKPEG